MYGASKFWGKRKPSSSAIPMAMSVYPLKSAYIWIGVPVDREEDLQIRVGVRRAEDGVDDRRRDVGRDHHLLEEAGGDEPRGTAEVDVPGIPLVADLREELLAPHDRAGHQVWEE